MNEPINDWTPRLVRRHLLWGWWGLLVFLSLGIALETMHGFKLGFYLDRENNLRRLLWTLAHAHGTLLALMQIGFAFTVLHLGSSKTTGVQVASWSLINALLLLPTGFFAGGIGLSEVDPSPGILLVPVGAFFLLLGVGITVWMVTATKQ